MRIVGMNYVEKNDGTRSYTLHVSEPFNTYYNNPEAGRGCLGEKVDTIYAGAYDCSHLRPGMEVDILFDKAIQTSRGTFQPVKKIEIIKGNVSTGTGININKEVKTDV